MIQLGDNSYSFFSPDVRGEFTFSPQMRYRPYFTVNFVSPLSKPWQHTSLCSLPHKTNNPSRRSFKQKTLPLSFTVIRKPGILAIDRYPIDLVAQDKELYG